MGKGGRPVDVNEEKLDREREWGECGVVVGEEGASGDKFEGPALNEAPLAESNKRLAGRLPRRASRDGGIGAGRWLG